MSGPRFDPSKRHGRVAASEQATPIRPERSRLPTVATGDPFPLAGFRSSAWHDASLVPTTLPPTTLWDDARQGSWWARGLIAAAVVNIFALGLVSGLAIAWMVQRPGPSTPGSAVAAQPMLFPSEPASTPVLRPDAPPLFDAPAEPAPPVPVTKTAAPAPAASAQGAGKPEPPVEAVQPTWGPFEAPAIPPPEADERKKPFLRRDR